MVTRTPTKRLVLLTGLAAVLGFAGGGAAWVLVHLIQLLTNLFLFHEWTTETRSLADYHPDWTLFVAAVGAALLISLLAKWAPVIRGHGIPEAMEAVLTKQSKVAPRTAIAKPVSAALAIGSGAPFGAEGPIIVTGGSIGSLLGQVIPVSASERKILLAAGAAAGMSATFGAPLASVVLAVELLLFEFSARALVPLVVSTAVASGMHSVFFGAGPLFRVPAHDFAGLDVLPAFALLGLACGVLAIVLSRGLFLVEDLYRKLPVSEFWHPAIGALAFATVGLFVPRALGVGYDAIGDVLDARLALGTVAALAAGKLVAWWLALGSGTSGGTLAPILLISASFGSVVGAGINDILPGPQVAIGGFAVVAMAATFGAATQATFTAIVFVFELTRDYQVIVPLMVATVLADIVYSAVCDDSLMTEKLRRRGLHFGRHYGADPFMHTRVADIMTIPEHAVDAAGDAPTVRPGDPALTALRAMVEEEVEEILVLDEEGAIVGRCTLPDLLKVRKRQLDLEARPAWGNGLGPRRRNPA